MSILDKFVLMYTADTQQATTAINQLDQNAQKAGRTATQEFTRAFQALGIEAKQSERMATDSLSRLADSYKRTRSGSAVGASVLQQPGIMARQTGAATPGAGPMAFRALAEGRMALAGLSAAPTKGETQMAAIMVAQTTRLINAMKGRPGVGEKPAAPSPAPIPGMAQLRGVAGVLPGVSNLIGLASAVGMATAAVGAFSWAVARAKEETEKARVVQKEAWETGRSIMQYNRAVATGQKLGMTEEEVKGGMTGVKEKLMGAARQPFGEERFWFRKAGMGGDIARFAKSGDIEAATEAVMKHTRALAKAKGPNEGIAWAMYRAGASFELAKTWVTATDEALKKAADSAKEEAINRRAAQMQTEQYAKTQRELDNAFSSVNRKIASDVSPSLARFTQALAKSAQESDGAVAGLGKFVSAIIDVGTNALTWGDKMMKSVKDLSATSDVTSERIAAGKRLTEKGIKGEGFMGGFSEEQMQAEITRGRSAGIDSRSEASKAADKAKEPALIDAYRKIETAISATKATAAEKSKAMEELQKRYGQAVAAGSGKDSNWLQAAMTEQLEELRKQTSVAKATLNHTQPVRVVQMPPPIGLEQALSLWAAGIGKAAALTPPSGAEAAGSRAHWEEMARRKQMAQLSPAYQPHALVGREAFKRAIGTGAAVGVSRPGLGVSVDHNTTVNQTYNIQSSDARSVAQQVSDTSKKVWLDLSNESIKQMVNEFTDAYKA